MTSPTAEYVGELAVLASVKAGVWLEAVTVSEAACVSVVAPKSAVAVAVLVMDPASMSAWSIVWASVV